MTSFPILSVLNNKALLLEFAILNIKVRYKGTHLGFLWTAIEPLLIFVLLYVVFTSIRLGDKENFAIYLLSGIVLYHIFSRGTMSGMTSLRINTGIIKSINLKREFFPTASTLSTTLLAIVEIGVLLSLMPVFQFSPTLTILLVPLPFILLLIFILGLSYLLSIINIYLKDIQTIWAIIVQTLLFTSPIFWYLSDVDELLHIIQSINPVGQIIELNHQIVVFGQIPPLSDWLYTTVFVFATLFLGFGIFKKFEKKISEEL